MSNILADINDEAAIERVKKRCLRYALISQFTVLIGRWLVQCPFCFAANTKVIDSRLVTEGNAVRRRRECQVCQERFTSFETAELLMPRVVKSNGVRDPFNEEKLRHGIVRALEKRPVSVDQIEASRSNHASA